MLEDANNEPQYGERVPYIIARGEPGMKLVDRAISPEEIFLNSTKRIDAEYYISRVLIPPLERIFNLMGADVRSWYHSMMKGAVSDNLEAVLASPEKVKPEAGIEPVQDEELEKAAIDSHFRSNQCLLCSKNTEETVCQLCRCNPEESLHALQGRVQEAERRLVLAHDVCRSCTSSPPAEDIRCESLECPWRFARKRTEEDVDALQGISELIGAIEQLAEDPGQPLLEEDEDFGSDDEPDSASSDVFM